MTEKKSMPTPTRLLYKKGDLVMKQGDYGVSVYRVLAGNVQLLVESGDNEVPQALRGPGEIFGEMSLLRKGGEIRTLTARALEDSELEAWHPESLIHQYQQVSPVLKHVTNHVFIRVRQMNILAARTAAQLKERRGKIKYGKDPWNSRRLYYRKHVDSDCRYAPLGDRPSPLPPLKGRIKNISMGGVAIEIALNNVSAASHKKGDAFEIESTLPNGKPFKATAEIVRTAKAGEGRLLLGMSFTDLSNVHGAKSTLGFFLLPT